MLMDEQLLHDVAAVRQLRESELRLRQRARLIELIPMRHAEARRLFRLASVVRNERLEILDRCGLS